MAVLFVLILAAATLAACSAFPQANQNPGKPDEGEVYSRDARVELGNLEKEINGTMPVISIQTVESTSNSLKFIDEPISKHVAQDIASWTPNYKMPPEPYYVNCRISVLNQDQETELDNADAQVKVRGNWTSSYPKKPLRIKFKEKKNILGLNDGGEYKDWLLLAEYKDASMLRNKVSFDVANAILKEDGLYGSDSMLVSVVVNGDYRGIYLLCEQQEIKKGRVAGTSLKKEYVATDIGYLFEMDGYYNSEDDMHRFHVSYNDNAPLVPYDGAGGSGKTMKCLPDKSDYMKKDIGFSIKSDINSKKQTKFIENFVENTYRIMYEAAYHGENYVFTDDFSSINKTDEITPREAIERVVNVNSLADMYIISELTCDADIYWSSFYMSADFGPDGDKKLTFQAPWDFDSGLGNKNRCLNGKGYYAANIVPDVNGYTDYGGQYDTINPWLAVLMYQDWYLDIIKDKWTRIYDAGVFDDAVEMIETHTDKYAEEFKRNYKKWNNIIDNGEFVGELSQPARACKTQADAAAFLERWFKARVEFMNGEWHN